MSQVPPPVPPQPDAAPNAAAVAKKSNTTKVVLIVLAIVFAVSILMCAGLAAITMPALAKAREQARRIVDASQLRQIAIVLHEYAADYQGQLPLHITHSSYIDDDGAMLRSPWDNEAELMMLPAMVEGNSRTVYRYGGYIFAHAYDQTDTDSPRYLQLSDIALPSQTIMAFGVFRESHPAGRNVLFADAHVEWVDPDRFADLIREQNETHGPLGLPLIDMAEVAKLD